MDNGCVLIPERYLQIPAVQELRSPAFYTDPVCLKDVGDSHFLGFQLDTRAFQSTYILPRSAWQLKSPFSAGSQRLLISGLKSPCVLVLRQTYPQTLFLDTLVALAHFYVNHAYPPDLVWPTMRRVALRISRPLTSFDFAASTEGRVCVTTCCKATWLGKKRSESQPHLNIQIRCMQAGGHPRSESGGPTKQPPNLADITWDAK